MVHNGGMTIDERLERLAERHEALAQTVELIAIAQQRNDEQIRELGLAVRKLTSVIEMDAQIVRSRADVAANHERRLTHLEGGE